MASVDPRERIIALLDLDAFYAQVEMKRLNSAPSIPLAVRQWDGLIAVNYAARAAGVTRHMRADEALTRCPSIKLVHVELIDADGVVPDDAMARHSQRTAKASLARYRAASRAIFALLVRALGETNVEKGSVDEAYLQLDESTTRVLSGGRALLCERVWDSVVGASTVDAGAGSGAGAGGGAGASIGGGGRCRRIADEPNSNVAAALKDALLSATDTWVVQSGADAESGNISTETLGFCSSRLLAASYVVSKLRALIQSELGFTSSAGIAQNKMLAKLVAGRHKPAAQTILPAACVLDHMRRTPLSAIRFLGGKLGAALEALVAGRSSAQESESVADEGEEGADAKAEEDDDQLGQIAAPQGDVRGATAGDAQGLTIEALRQRFAPDTALFLWEIVRGIDKSPLVPRSKTQSLMSAKSMSARDCRTLADAAKYFAMNAYEVVSRLRDFEPRRPKTLNIHFRREDGGTGTRSSPFPPLPHTVDVISRAALGLLRKVADDAGLSATGRPDEEVIFPCVSLTIGAAHFAEAQGQQIDGMFAAQRAMGTTSTSLTTAARVQVEEAPRKMNTLDVFFVKGTAPMSVEVATSTRQVSREKVSAPAATRAKVVGPLERAFGLARSLDANDDVTVVLD